MQSYLTQISDMLPLFVRKPTEGEIDALCYELAGVVDFQKAVDRHGVDAMYDFMTHGHPGNAKCRYKPSMVQALTREKPGTLAIFLATSEANPNSDRVLFTEKDIKRYREAYPMVEFTPETRTATADFFDNNRD